MVDEETSKKIQELQLLEQNIQFLLHQKQTLQVELNEIANAEKEIKSSKEVYKVLSGVMIKSDPETISKELEEKKKRSEMRIAPLEKQESLIKEKISKIREEITSNISQKKK